MMQVLRVGIAALAVLGSQQSAWANSDLRTTLRLEYYGFKEAPLSAEQIQSPNRLALDIVGFTALTETLDLSFDGTAGRAIEARGYNFGRINRLSLDQQWGSATVSVGVHTLVWSKSEFSKLSNVLNARDYRFDPTGETTRGQPMLKLDIPMGAGLLTAAAIPRPLASFFPNQENRLRSQIAVTEDVQFENDRSRPAYALRYETSVGIADIGAFAYDGASREEAIVHNGTGFGPYYSQVQQIGLDAQFTFGSSVAKAELRHTSNQRDRLGNQGSGFAASIGAEHTFYGVLGTAGDVTAAFEYAWDERGKQSWQNNQNDLYAGIRWSLQNAADTQLELGLQRDFDFNTSALRIGFEHRIVDGLKLTSSAIFWLKTNPQDLAYGLSNDSNIHLKIEKSF